MKLREIRYKSFLYEYARNNENENYELHRILCESIEKRDKNKGIFGKILNKKVYKNYYITTELSNNEWIGLPKNAGPQIEIKAAYNMNGDYIGDDKIAKKLCKKLGIYPELSNKNNSVCSVGFSDNDDKWYRMEPSCNMRF